MSLQVREELEAQLSRFRELLGRSPTHVDGHQHVHVLPGTRIEAPGLGGGFFPGLVGGRC